LVPLFPTATAREGNKQHLIPSFVCSGTSYVHEIEQNRGIYLRLRPKPLRMAMLTQEDLTDRANPLRLGVC